MPTRTKTAANMVKNMTQAELQARQEAEAEVIPQRDKLCLKKPKLMEKNASAARYWKLVLARMAGYAILDDLDSEALGVYCSQLARYETLAKQVKTVGEKLDAVESDDARTLLKLIESLSSLEGKIQALERNILQYADKLGLTPAGRARLAMKRAEQASEDDPDADLFG